MPTEYTYEWRGEFLDEDPEFTAFLYNTYYANDEYTENKLTAKIVMYSEDTLEQKKQRAHTKLRNILNYAL